MGQTASSIQSLPSSDIASDTNILLHVFQGRFEVEKVSRNDNDKEDDEENEKDGLYSIFLQSPDGFVVLLVRQHPRPENSVPVTWVTDQPFIEKALASRNEDQINNGSTWLESEEIHGFTVAVLSLSACTIFLLPPVLANSTLGRVSLAKKLSDFGRTQQAKSMRATSASPPPGSISNGSSLSSTASSPGSDNERTLKVFSTPSGTITKILRDEDGNEQIRTPPKFPLLDVKLLRQGQGHDQTLLPNTVHTQDFETDLFKGKVLLVLKPPKPDNDPYWTDLIFAKKKRTFVLLVQGKFKRKPTGQVYVGGEITKPIQVGLLTRGIMLGLLRFVQSFSSDVVSSFGVVTKGQEENPRVVVPAHWAFSTVEITPPGEEPPAMNKQCDPFTESDAQKAKRAKAKFWDWNTTDTYSFSFFSMYFNFVDWKIVNVPVSKGINLSNMWGDAALRIVMYESLEDEGTIRSSNSKSQRHPQRNNQYYFSMQLKHSPDAALDDEDEEESDIQEYISMSNRTSGLLGQHAMPSNSRLMHSESVCFFPDDAKGHESSDEEYYDAAEIHVPVEDCSEGPYAYSSAEGISLSAINATVPAWVVIPNCKGTCTKCFAINVGNKTLFRSRSDCDSYTDKSGLRDEASSIISKSFSPRLSSFEKRRRMLAYVLSKQTNADVSAGKFSFLAGSSFSGELDADVLLSGPVGRALSDHQWVEEWMTAGKNGVISFRRADKKNPSCWFTSQSVASVKVLNSDACPAFFGFAFLCIETLGRSIYLMFSSHPHRDSWLKTIIQLTEKMRAQRDGNKAGADDDVRFHLEDVDSPAQEFMHDSSVWDCKKRRIYNCAMFTFHALAETRKLLSPHPIALVKHCLQLAVEAANDESLLKRHNFLMSAALLKSVNLEHFSESEKLAFYLNLYHTMLLHSFLILGPPSSSRRFIQLFKEVAYQVGDDIMSLAQLEHCVIRAPMTSPSAFLSRFVIPKSVYRHKLRKPDFRINFALNCGSKSCPSDTFLYSPDKISEQLDAAARLGLKNVSVVFRSQRELVITLPRTCQWYLQDFGKFERDLLSRIAPYLRAEDRQKLAPFYQKEKEYYDMSCISICFEDFSFTCRPLSLL